MDALLLITIPAALLSGLVTFFISTYFYLRQERRKEKFSVLKELMANRHGLTPGGSNEAKGRFFQSLNATFAVFHDSTPVIEALEDFKKHPMRTSDNVTQLLRRMSEDLKIDTSYLDDDFFNGPFTPRT